MKDELKLRASARVYVAKWCQMSGETPKIPAQTAPAAQPAAATDTKAAFDKTAGEVKKDSGAGQVPVQKAGGNISQQKPGSSQAEIKANNVHEENVMRKQNAQSLRFRGVRTDDSGYYAPGAKLFTGIGSTYGSSPDSDGNGFVSPLEFIRAAFPDDTLPQTISIQQSQEALRKYSFRENFMRFVQSIGS